MRNGYALLALTLAVGALTCGAGQRPADGVRDQPPRTETAPPPAPPPPQPPPAPGIWASASELAARPMSGLSWDTLHAAAAEDCDRPKLNNQNDKANVCVLAKALVFARTADLRLQLQVVDALRAIVGQGRYNGTALALGRELGTYVIAADLIDLKTFDPTFDATFRTELTELLTTETDEGPDTLVECHEQRPNNWGTHCGASRAAVAAYLGDTAALARVAQVFKGWLGDRASYAGFEYGDLSWQCDPDAPVGINPKGCTRNGHSLDGVLPDDQRRGGRYKWPPSRENYVYEALQGALMQAVILQRAGYDAFNWQDRALLRAFEWLHTQAQFPSEGDDTWQPSVINFYYLTAFPVQLPTRPGKNMGFTDWTHQR
jgi:hypothetical protein